MKKKIGFTLLSILSLTVAGCISAPQKVVQPSNPDTGVQQASAEQPDPFKKSTKASVKTKDEKGFMIRPLEMELKEGRPYLLVGPGRWGSADRWLGIPVVWKNISGVRAIVELRNNKIKADPSQGSHFFQNITSLGIHYVTVTEEPESGDYFDWHWVEGLPVVREMRFVRHVRLDRPFMLKIDGRTSGSVMVAN